MLSNFVNTGSLSLRDLEYVVAISTEGSFVRAAEKCNVSQPSLSAQVRKLEDLLGVSLFERTTRRVLVTEQGKAFVTQARRVLSEARVLLSLSSTDSRLFSGPLHLSAISTLGPYVFPRILPGLRRAYPAVSLVLGEGLTADLLLKLSDGLVDAILISLPQAEGWLATHALFQEPFVLACPPERKPVSDGQRRWETMQASERLLMEEGHCLRQQAIDACAFTDRSSRHGTSLETLKYMVAAGEGSTLVPKLATSATDPVSYSPLPAQAYSRTIALAWRSSDPRSGHYLNVAETISKIVMQLDEGLRGA